MELTKELKFHQRAIKKFNFAGRYDLQDHKLHLLNL